MTDETRGAGFKIQGWHILAVIILIAYLPVLYDLVIDWSTDDNYSHGFLVPLVAGYFLWRARARILIMRAESSIHESAH